MHSDWINALRGGILIGLSVSLMLLWNGRVGGVSGILSGLVKPVRGDVSWRLYFVGGLILGGFTLEVLNPTLFAAVNMPTDWTVVAAGLLVGFGTTLGGGCTSGHGVCGVSRLSPRSIVATLVFIVAGVLAVALLKRLGVIS